MKCLLTAVASLLVLAGCGSAEPIAGGAAAPQTASATTTVQQSAVATDDPCLEHAYDEDACREKMEAAADEMGDCHPDDTNCDGIYQVDPGDVEAPEPEDEDDGTYAADYEINITGASWKSQGARVRISRLSLADRDKFCGNFDELDAPDACYDDIYDGETIVALDMKVVNNTGRDIEWYADQAQLGPC